MNNLSSLDEISLFCSKKIGANLIIDTNIFLLLFLGTYNKDYMRKSSLMTNNNKNYTNEHYDLMLEIIKRFRNNIVITPHVLSEINMLSRRDVKKPHFEPYFTKMLEKLLTYKEHLVELQILLKNKGINEFGFTDMTLIEAATKNDWAILTDEINLYTKYRETVPVIYFSNIVVTEIHKVHL